MGLIKKPSLLVVVAVVVLMDSIFSSGKHRESRFEKVDFNRASQDKFPQSM